MKYVNKRIAIDIDGTLTKLKKLERFDWDYLINLEPDEEMLKLVNELYEENTIYIHTGRQHKFKQITKIWLDKIGIKYHYLVMDKLTAEVYIDDRSIHPEVFKLRNQLDKSTNKIFELMHKGRELSMEIGW